MISKFGDLKTVVMVLSTSDSELMVENGNNSMKPVINHLNAVAQKMPSKTVTVEV
jgi:hypothetical protein